MRCNRSCGILQRARRARRTSAWLPGGCILLCFAFTGCKDKPWLDPQALMPAAPEVVEAFGFTLDDKAGPEEVAWVLLQAIEEDLQAKPYSEERVQAIGLQCRLFNVEPLSQMDALRQRGVDPGEFYFTVFIRNWAPALNHYVRYLPERFEEFRDAVQRSPSVGNNGREMATLRYALHGSDHGGPEGLQYGVTIRMVLGKTTQGYWRAEVVNFDRSPDLPT